MNVRVFVTVPMLRNAKSLRYLRRAFLINLGRAALLALFLLSWQRAVDTGLVNRFVVAAPTSVAKEIWSSVSSGAVWAPLVATMKELLAGYVLGLVVGVSVGCLIGVSNTARAYLEPFLVFLNSLPRLVLVPVFIVLFGFGSWPKILAVFAVIVMMIIFTVSTGIGQIQGYYIQNARTLGAGRWNIMRDVYLPGVTVWILSSSRVAISFAFQAAVVAEFFGATKGLGYQIEFDSTNFDITAMYANILIVAGLAFILDVALSQVQRRATVWLR